MLSYILQVIAFQLLFLIGYELLLKRETFFTYNRWYLLSTSIIALLLPLINIESLSFLIPQETFSNLSTVWLPEIFIGEQQQFSETLPAVQITAQTQELNFWAILYFPGFFGSLYLLLRKYQHLSSLFRFKVISEEKEYRIIEVPDSDIACTFYKTILLGDQLSEEERSQILSHELIHVKQKHSLDLIYFEVSKIVFWFNPLIHIYQNNIASVHEFIADEAVVKNTGKLNYYEQLLNRAFSTRNISFINQFFNHSLTRLTVFGKTLTFGSSGGQVKKRIFMLQKSKSTTIAKFKYLVIVPLIFIMLTSVAFSEAEANPLQDRLQTNEKDPKTNLENKTVPGAINPVQNNDPLPFAIVEEPPVFPGCDQKDSKEQKNCLAQNIAKHVNKNFDLTAILPYMKTGSNRIVVQFKIDEKGEVSFARSRMVSPGPDPEAKAFMEEEANRVVKSLPTMKPAMHKGKIVAVLYSLPIELFKPEEGEK